MDWGSLAGGAISAGADIWGAEINSQATEQANQANIAYQREAAQNGIQWRVADAEKAGINPLYALGGGAGGGPGEQIMADTAMGTGVQQAGQDISRAVSATMSSEDREKKDALDAANLEHAKLSNDLLKVNISNAARNQPVNPAMPIANAPAVSYRPGVVPDTYNEAAKLGWTPGMWDALVSDQGVKQSASDNGFSWKDVSRGLTDIYHLGHMVNWMGH